MLKIGNVYYLKQQKLISNYSYFRSKFGSKIGAPSTSVNNRSRNSSNNNNRRAENRRAVAAVAEAAAPEMATVFRRAASVAEIAAGSAHRFLRRRRCEITL